MGWRADRTKRQTPVGDVSIMAPIEWVTRVFEASDADATRALYAHLCGLGPEGVLAMNLLRAQKNSIRAKVYRGGNGHGSYRAQAYDRKAYSLGQLCDELTRTSHPMIWGWKIDPKQEFHRWVLYVDTPVGQVSFHSEARGLGPDYPAEWDEVKGASTGRIISWAANLIKERVAA